MKLRSDAQSNRDRILEVARVALSDDPQASLHSIAKIAEVGQATFYRHFPTREALALAIYRREVDALVDLAPDLLASQEPRQALRIWCSRFAEAGRKKRPIADVIQAAMTDTTFQETYLPLVEAMTSLVGACIRSGQIREDVEPEDVLIMLGLLMRIPPDMDGERRTERLIEIVLKGLTL